ncbi:MAG: Eco57I restriction-modification methylase domain-containing protein [Chloroflexota bacterium]|nr:Eco57I restriction-modification methylase domain-containing protein [Chloroflexota bacterium]
MQAMGEWRDLWELYCPDLSRDELDSCDWLQRVSTQWLIDDISPVEFSDRLGQAYSDNADALHRKAHGQFFTPPGIARFMAGWSSQFSPGARVIDPGAGVGILLAALAEHIAKEANCSEWHATAYETDVALRPALEITLGYIRHWLNRRNIHFTFEATPEDFILSNTSVLRPTPMFGTAQAETAPHLVIANPPYFKLPKTDHRVAVLREVVNGQPNIYALFMAAAAKLLQSDGQLIFITPRSFCSGPYFRQFRKWFFHCVALERLHLFESRTEAFERDKVLQENVIIAARKTSVQRDSVEISSSHGAEGLDTTVAKLVPLDQVLDLSSPEVMLNIPLGPSDSAVREAFNQWNDRLHAFGLDISTGPIVPFRTAALVSDRGDFKTAPVLWVQHVERMAITWPLMRFAKPQQIRVEPDTRALLLPNANYVLVRRFSPKEENSRITAAPYFKDSLPSDFLGIENHINYLHRPGASLSIVEAVGFAAFLNSRWVDQYFRLSSGNTQVSATELRNLPLPPFGKILGIGERLLHSDGVSQIALMNQVVGEELDLPLELTNGGHMSKIEEAKDLLNALGLPPAQRNELAALTLLALAGLTETDSWEKAQRRSIRIHDMIVFVEQNYHKRYAENTRETFRRQVLHQFEQARLVDLNPDDPDLATNSPRTHYAISEALLPIVRNYGTKTGQRHLEKFRSEQGTLLAVYQKRRAQHLIPLRDQSGREYRLSPGKHNQLQVAALEQFAPRFAPGAKLLYLGDAAHKTLVMDVDGLTKVGFPANKHNKLPDVVLYLPTKKWLFLIEVVTSHGPVSPKRYQELERMLAKSPVGRVYVSVFPDFREFNRHTRNTAWETEVWIAEAPDHLIHYNGDKFMGPHQLQRRQAK